MSMPSNANAMPHSRALIGSTGDHDTAERPADALDAAVGIKNGFLYAAGFWAFAYLAFSLIKFIV